MRRLLSSISLHVIIFVMALAVTRAWLTMRTPKLRRATPIPSLYSTPKPPPSENSTASNTQTDQHSELDAREADEEIWVGDIFTPDETLRHNGFVIESRRRSVQYPVPPSTIDVSYAVLKRKDKVMARFDGDIYFSAGNSVRFGLFSFLGGTSKQVVITQDVFRGGTQWIVNLSPGHRTIFSGPTWIVGREGDDMRIIDLDNDGVYEIVVPITDFYDLQDKLPIGRIPLPEVVFKYEAGARKYFPANPMFEAYVLRELDDPSNCTATDDFGRRSAALKKLLAYIYVGKEKLAWQVYERSYRLSDKDELRQRVKTILGKQPVYKFIYNPHSYK